MSVLSRTRLSIAVVLGITALLLATLVAPASAKPKDESRDKAPTPAYTEDNDTNDNNTRNNVADAGDNRHPSGKDRSIENGASGNQGKAQADPDDDGRGPDRTNGGADQPGGRGGADKADQDGNNGCGNDDDFEDDNEGHCGRPTTATPDKPTPAKPSKPTTPTKPVKPTKPTKPTKPGGNGNNGGGNGNNGGGNNPGKIGICHATGSMTNPYVFITVSHNAADHGHAGHDRDVIGATSLTDCPTDPTDPTEPPKPPTGDKPTGDTDDDTDVGGVIIVRPPNDNDDNDNNDNDVITRRPTTPNTPDAVITGRGRVLAATGSTTTILASIAALTLTLGAGLLGIRRYAPKQ